MIGKTVSYSNRDVLLEGEVLDKIDMLNDTNSEREKPSPVVTGYLVKSTKDGLLYPIQYWRIKSILN